MKKRSFLAIMMAGLLFASCDKTNDPNNNVGSGEYESSYIAVNVNSVFDPTMRADNDYQEGTEIEQKVTSAHFFFFDANGNPFTLNQESLVGATGQGNYIVKKDLGDKGQELPNVETITDVVLTIRKNKGEYPAKMLVVLNWDYTGEAIALDALNQTLIAAANYKSDAGFLMSNSVYAQNNQEVNATPITMDNIGLTAEDAKAKPVTVYVERVAAKVSVKETIAEGTTFNTGEEANGTQVYAKIVGWDINTTISHSYLVKDITPDWSLNFTWNDEPYRRSYWANSVAATGSVTYNRAFTWNDIEFRGNEAGETNFDYCFENTTSTEADRTKVVIATRLVNANGDSLIIAELYSQYYTIEGLQNLVASTLEDQYYYKDGETYKSIEHSHITFTADKTEGKDSYTVKYVLTTEAADLSWYTYSNGVFTESSSEAVNAKLATLERARIWNGKSYYTVDIEHIPGAESKNFGVVRNHSYVINVTGIKGLGTPVYDPNSKVETPVEPEETESYVAAQIKVLSWRIVNQNVTLQ